MCEKTKMSSVLGLACAFWWSLVAVSCCYKHRSSLPRCSNKEQKTHPDKILKHDEP